MSSVNKIIKKFKNSSNNITFNETQRLLKKLGYKTDSKGKTSGSKIAFLKNGSQKITLHKPHIRNTLLAHQRQTIVEVLKKEGKI